MSKRYTIGQCSQRKTQVVSTVSSFFAIERYCTVVRTTPGWNQSTHVLRRPTVLYTSAANNGYSAFQEYGHANQRCTQPNSAETHASTLLNGRHQAINTRTFDLCEALTGGGTLRQHMPLQVWAMAFCIGAIRNTLSWNLRSWPMKSGLLICGQALNLCIVLGPSVGLHGIRLGLHDKVRVSLDKTVVPPSSHWHIQVNMTHSIMSTQ